MEGVIVTRLFTNRRRAKDAAQALLRMGFTDQTAVWVTAEGVFVQVRTQNAKQADQVHTALILGEPVGEDAEVKERWAQTRLASWVSEYYQNVGIRRFQGGAVPGSGEGRDDEHRE